MGDSESLGKKEFPDSMKFTSMAATMFNLLTANNMYLVPCYVVTFVLAAACIRECTDSLDFVIWFVVKEILDEVFNDRISDKVKTICAFSDACGG